MNKKHYVVKKEFRERLVDTYAFEKLNDYTFAKEHSDTEGNEYVIFVDSRGFITGYKNKKKLTKGQISNFIYDLIADDGVYETEKVCSRCENHYLNHTTYYRYEDDVYCDDCLLEELKDNNIIEENTTTNYFINGEYIGNSDDDIIESLIDNIVDLEEVK